MNAVRSIRWLACVSGLWLGACAPQDPHRTPPPSPELRAKLGSVWLRAVAAKPSTSLAQPYTPGEAAAAGSMQGLGGIAHAGNDGLLLPLVLPLAVVGGGLVGGMMGTPGATGRADWEALGQACNGVDFQKGLRRDLMACLRHPPRVALAADPRHASTIMEVRVLQAGLDGGQFRTSKLKAFLEGEARLLDPAGTLLYHHVWIECGHAQTFNQWASQNGRSFRQELAILSRSLARRIASEMFPQSGPAGTPTRSRDLWWDQESFPDVHSEWNAP